MPYKVAITPRIKSKLEAVLGKGADLSKISVYEARSNDTRMIARTGGILKNSRMDESYLQGMSAMLEQGAYIPLASHHFVSSQHAQGRTFDGAVYDAADGSGAKELHTLFYLMSNTDPESIDARLESGIINSVSTNTIPSAILCSKCNFNFLENKANTALLYSGNDYETPECVNGHVSGVDGTHLILSGTPKIWKEQSLVMNGAVTGASVLDDKSQKLSAENSLVSLAASSLDDKLAVITNSVDDNPVKQIPKGAKDMKDITIELAEYNKGVVAVARLAEVETQLSAANTAKDTAVAAQLAAETDKEAALAAKLTAENEKAEAITAKELADAEIVKLNAQIATLGSPATKTTPAAKLEASAAGVYRNAAQFKHVPK